MMMAYGRFCDYSLEVISRDPDVEVEHVIFIFKNEIRKIQGHRGKEVEKGGILSIWIEWQPSYSFFASRKFYTMFFFFFQLAVS